MQRRLCTAAVFERETPGGLVRFWTPSLLLLCIPAAAQGGDVQERQLQPIASYMSQERIKGIVMPIKCDADGNIYTRAASMGEPYKNALGRVKKFNPRGA